MLQTFKAHLKGYHLDWLNDKPYYSKQQIVTVHVTFVEENLPVKTAKNTQIAILEKIAHLRNRRIISDPIAWQKEERRDRENIRGKRPITSG